MADLTTVTGEGDEYIRTLNPAEVASLLTLEQLLDMANGAPDESRGQFASVVRDMMNDREFLDGLVLTSFLRSSVDILIRERMNQGLSRKELAKLIGGNTSGMMVENFERLEGSISLTFYCRYAIALGMVPMLFLSPEHLVHRAMYHQPNLALDFQHYLPWYEEHQQYLITEEQERTHGGD